MTSIITTSEKFDWENALFWAIACLVVYYVVIAANEGNKMFWLGVLALIPGITAFTTSENRQSKRSSNAQVLVGLLFFLFALVSPFLHLDTRGLFVNDKVWMVDGKTTMSHNVLWRSPFSKFATSINEDQNVSFVVSGMTKDGTAVRATLSGEFRISGDEKVVIKRFGEMRDPDAETKDLLKKVLQKSFAQVIATMTVVGIATAKNNFSIEHAIVTATTVDSLGLKGSGPIVVSGLHPYFVDK